MAIAVTTNASHVHNLSACEGARVTNMFQRGLHYVTGSVSKTLRSIGCGQTGSIVIYRHGSRVI